jgi:hypothetical protein
MNHFYTSRTDINLGGSLRLFFLYYIVGILFILSDRVTSISSFLEPDMNLSKVIRNREQKKHASIINNREHLDASQKIKK